MSFRKFPERDIISYILKYIPMPFIMQIAESI